MIPKCIIKNAKEAALRDGYDQAIIKQTDDYGYCFSRKYDGCCPEWFGKIVNEIIVYYENGIRKTKVV